MSKTVIAIDFGTSYTSIYKKQIGVVLKEPTLLAVTNKNGKIFIETEDLS